MFNPFKYIGPNKDGIITVRFLNGGYRGQTHSFDFSSNPVINLLTLYTVAEITDPETGRGSRWFPVIWPYRLSIITPRFYIGFCLGGIICDTTFEQTLRDLKKYHQTFITDIEFKDQELKSAKENLNNMRVYVAEKKEEKKN